MDDHMQSPGLIPLASDTLDHLPGNVLRPRYDRSALTPGIVHIGLGNFHRAHQAWYLHRLMQQGKALDWAIIGAGVRPNDQIMRDKLRAQDHLTTLIELAPDSRAVEVIGPMIDFVPVAPDNASLIATMAQACIRIVSLTVTEGGYFTDAETGALDHDHPEIRHDAANPGSPQTAFGAIVQALRLRRAQGLGPFTVQSCDNLQGNGTITRRVVTGLARMQDPALADWIDDTCSFPNAMVDCIVPATGPGEMALARDLGIADAVPVTHEDFRQWVIEDDFCAGRPPWDQVGATFAADIHAYEAQKIRILNGGHQVIAVAGEVLGVETIAECMAHPQISGLFRKVAHEEIQPLVAAVPAMTPKAYTELVIGRFSNPRIVDTTRRVAFDGSSRHPGFVLPSVRDALAKGTPVDGLALVEAIWARMCAGTREDGSAIAPNDPFWDMLTAQAQAARETPARWLEMAQIYADLAHEPRFAQSFEHWLTLIWDKGLTHALDVYLAR